MHLCRSSSNVPRLPAFLKLLQTLTFYALLARCRIPCACHAKPRPNFQKWSETVSFFTLFTSKCAFDISTSKSALSMLCFVHFDFGTCFAPQRRALFRHLNFQKGFDVRAFCTFWLQNVLRATTASTFSTSQLPKVVRSRCALYILTWKCASRHNGVHLFISHLARWLRTRRFSEPTFRPSGATNHWKNTVFRDFATFSRTCIFCLLTLSFLWSSFFFSSLTLPTSAFSCVHIVGSLTSKLPSMKKMTIPSTSSTGSPCFQQVALFAPSSASLLRSSSKRTDSMVVT